MAPCTRVQMLPAEQLLMLILYTMTLPVYLSNMPVDTLARELSEWGKEMSSHPNNDDDDHWFETLCSHINKTTSDAIRRRFRPRKCDQGSIRAQRIEVAGASSHKPPANEDSPFFSLLSAQVPPESTTTESVLQSSESGYPTTSRFPGDNCSVRVAGGGVLNCLKREAAAAGLKSIRLSEATTI